MVNTAATHLKPLDESMVLNASGVCRIVLIGLLALAAIQVPANAGVLTGDTVQLRYYFPDLNTAYADYGTLTAPGTFGNVLGLIDVNVGDSTIVVNFTDGGGWVDLVAFNGFVLTDLTNAPITSVTINPATNMAGFTSSTFTFDASSISVDWQGLSFTPGGVVQLDLNGNGVPEPAAWTLTGAGILAALAVFRRRRRV
jgi:hypothetical protein